MFALSGLLTEVLDFSIAPLNCIFMRPFDPPNPEVTGCPCQPTWCNYLKKNQLNWLKANNVRRTDGANENSLSLLL